MQYAILIYGDEAAWARKSEAEMRAVYEAHGVFGRELEAAGAMRGGAELKPADTATTLRLEGGKVVTTDGPFAETREQLGGFYLIEAASLDEALRWAEKCPSLADGPIEVRPIAQTTDD